MTDRNKDRWDSLEDRADDRALSEAERFERHPFRTVLKWFAVLAVLCLCIGAIFGLVSWVGSWGGEAKRIASPENVRKQNTEIIQDWNDMEAAAQNVCGAIDAKSSPDDPTLLEDPAFAYKAQFRRIRVDYNRRMANLYEAQAVRKLPLPSNLRSYPKVAPSLKERIATDC
jgi:hypothetical protein